MKEVKKSVVAIMFVCVAAGIFIVDKSERNQRLRSDVTAQRYPLRTRSNNFFERSKTSNVKARTTGHARG